MNTQQRVELLQRIDRAFDEIRRENDTKDNFNGIQFAIEHAHLEVMRAIATLPIENR